MRKEQMNIPFEEMTLKDDFMFGVVMRKPEYCKPCLERILGVKIHHIKVPEGQKILDVSANAKSVRLDIYVENDADTVYNIEMQALRHKFLPKRSRYYQDIIDLNMLDKGEHYSQLKRSYVIFICTFDYFGEGRHIYTFENRCRENPELAFGDETVKIILNTKGTKRDASQELFDFLEYIENGIPTDDYTQELENEVNRVRKNEKWRLDYMTLYLKQQESYMDGKEDGIAEGMEKGKKQGIDMLTKAILLVREQGTNENELIAMGIPEDVARQAIILK